VTPEELLAPYPPHLREIAEALRVVVKRTVPEAIEGVRSGWRLIGYDVPFKRGTRFFAWIWPEFEHVHIGFEHGVLMDDPDQVLHGAELRLKRVRYLTLTSTADIDAERTAGFLLEAVRLVSLSRAERLGQLLDREERGERAPAG
jgi:hypothetical protein